MRQVKLADGEVYTEHDLSCPYCGAKMTLRFTVKFNRAFYGCSEWPRTKCEGVHGCHPSGAPLGIPATKEVKAARIRAHDAFDKLWKDGHMERGTAYRWMREAMGLSKRDAHIGRFDAEQCERLVALATQKLKEVECSLEPTETLAS